MMSPHDFDGIYYSIGILAFGILAIAATLLGFLAGVDFTIGSIGNPNL